MPDEAPSDAPEQSSNATVAAPVEKPTPAPKRPDAEGPPPRHAVILHNDPNNSYDFVVVTLINTLKIDMARAIVFTETAHRRGRCAVWTGLKEHAEFKAQLITSAGPDPLAVMTLGAAARPLKATVEPVPGT